MWSAEQYRDRVAGLVPPTPVVPTPLADCLGLVLAEDVVAGVSLPPFDNSAMDGYAVRAADLVGERTVLPVADDIPAGRTDVRPLEPGTAHRIMTGAPMPPGADAVVQVELTDGGTGSVELRARVEPGKHVRGTGEDVVAGTVVLRAGTVLGSAQLGLAAAVGVAALPVRRRPRVVVLSTGTELTPPGEPLAPGRIYESNSVLLAAAVRETGAEATTLRFVPDDVDSFMAAVADLSDADLLITSGGVSAGAYEVVKDALTGRGVEFLRVAMQPGGPQGSGRIDGGLAVVALPGNPVSTALSFELFVRPALLGALGHSVVDRPRARARTTEPMRSPSEKVQYRRGRHDAGAGSSGVGPDNTGSSAAGSSGAESSGTDSSGAESSGAESSGAESSGTDSSGAESSGAGSSGAKSVGVVEVVPVGGPGSHLLASFAESNCLIVLPVGVSDVAAGEEVELILLD